MALNQLPDPNGELFEEIREIVVEIMADHRGDSGGYLNQEESHLWTEDILEIVEKHLSRNG